MILTSFLLLSIIAIGQVKQTKYGVMIPENYQDTIDLVYKTVGDWQGRMDIYYNSITKKKCPLLINIHGGGWVNGNKERQRAYSLYLKNGFAVANIEYRLARVALAPAAIEDVRCALIHLINNADQFNIDKSRIVIQGSSAGGHLALIAGYLDNKGIFDNECPDHEKIKIAGIINRYGVTDLSIIAPEALKDRPAGAWFGDNISNINFLKKISPITYINKKSPPTLIIHGTADKTVSIYQSELLYKELTSKGVNCKFIRIKDAGHGGFSKEENDKIAKGTIEFFEENKIL